MTFYPRFTELFSRIFHLAKRKCMVKIFDSLLCQYIKATTDVDSINPVVGVDLQGFMVFLSI